MTSDIADDKKKRFRSPPYPTFDLGRAVEKADALEKCAQYHEVGVNTLLEAWEMKSTQGQVWRTVAALIQYGLVTDSGTGKTRKFKISDTGRRILRDPEPRSSKRTDALKSAALLPMIHKTLWNKYGAATNLSDTPILGYLTLDRADAGEAPYSASAAKEVISSYRKTVSYAGLDQSEAQDIEEDEDDIGDADIEGNSLECRDKPETERPEAPPIKEPIRRARNSDGKVVLNAKASVEDGRLRVSADVSADEIDALKDMLTKYQEILRMLN